MSSFFDKLKKGMPISAPSELDTPEEELGSADLEEKTQEEPQEITIVAKDEKPKRKPKAPKKIKEPVAEFQASERALELDDEIKEEAKEPEKFSKTETMTNPSA